MIQEQREFEEIQRKERLVRHLFPDCCVPLLSFRVLRLFVSDRRVCSVLRSSSAKSNFLFIFRAFSFADLSCNDISFLLCADKKRSSLISSAALLPLTRLPAACASCSVLAPLSKCLCHKCNSKCRKCNRGCQCFLTRLLKQPALLLQPVGARFPLCRSLCPLSHPRQASMLAAVTAHTPQFSPRSPLPLPPQHF